MVRRPIPLCGHLIAIQLISVALFAVEKRLDLATFDLSSLSLSLSPACSVSLSLSLSLALRLCSIHISLPPLVWLVALLSYLCTFIESRPVNCFTGGAVANSNDVSVLAVTLKVTPPDEGTKAPKGMLLGFTGGWIHDTVGSKCSRYWIEKCVVSCFATPEVPSPLDFSVASTTDDGRD